MIPGFHPETAVERSLLGEPELRRGWAWGRPRRGHPEGPVKHHVAAMLAAIAPDNPRREDLRLLTLLHELRRRKLKRGLAALCVGGGQGAAFVVERP